METIRLATESIAKAQKIAEQCPYRPKYHFKAPAQWMNDPNGPIFYKGEYHLFYQLNPYGDKWGNIHWGHAKSKDLVNWEHLPIALTPSVNQGENHCFSGCCVVNHGIPTIIYTSIGPNKPTSTGAEQWLAVSHDDMITWEKYTNNPIMTLKLHGNLDVRDWRDPYIWQENKAWYAILGGHTYKPRRGIVLLYKSQNLLIWEFIGPLLIGGDRKMGLNWECPNFFSLGGKFVLFVSPHRKVIYTIGTYENYKFNPGKWKILDHGRPFYAPNTMLDGQGRRIMWGWIKGGGNGEWNGCLTLPRILTLDQQGRLKIKPAPELKKLRDKHIHLDEVMITSDLKDSLKELNGTCLEIIVKFQLIDAKLFGLKIIDSFDNYDEIIIGYNSSKKQLLAGREKGQFIFYEEEEKQLKLHVFIDKSVIEVYANSRECITSRIYPKNIETIKIYLFAENGIVKLLSMDAWEIKTK